MEYNTFGDFLREIISSRGLTILKFAELTGNKSKTAIIRLLNNATSQKTIVKFAENLTNVIELTDEEKECMNRILMSDSASPVQKTAMDNLLMLFEKNNNVIKSKNICTAYNSELKEKTVSFDDLFDICLNGESLVIIEDIVSNELVFALDKIIHETANRKFSPTINHFFKFDEGIEAKGKQLLALMKLSTYLEYNAYEVRHRFPLEKKIIILTKNKGKRYMRLIEFYAGKKFYYSDTEIAEPFYNHLLYRQKLLKEHSHQMRSEPMKSEQLLEMLQGMAYYDSMPAIQINSTPQYMFIPFEIQQRVFEDCNYIGLGKDHPYIRPVVDLLKSRAEFIKNTVLPRKMIFTIDGLKSFFKNGKTGDYFRLLGGLTIDECKTTLNYILNKEGIAFKILKKDYQIYDTEFIVFGDKNIIIYDPIWGWWEGSMMAEFADKRMAAILTDFYHKVLWEKCCYSERESRELIEKMMNKFN